MPQIFIMLSPFAQQKLADAKETSLFLEELDMEVSQCISAMWKVPYEDVATSVANLIYTRHEADVQVEVRYTAGEDEYDLGVPFDPTLEEQRKLVNVLEKGTANDLCSARHLTLSVWCKPYRISLFKTCEKLSSTGWRKPY
jgi:hypothetical protein